MSDFYSQDDPCVALDPRCGGDGGERCEQCQRYAALVAPPRPARLPAGLALKLRGMADDFAEADPLYIRALAGEPLAGEVPAEEAENPGRRAAHDALAVTFAEARRPKPLPPALRARLRSVPRRHAAGRLPVWLADSRWATAASLVLTATLALLAGDASARFQQTAAVFAEPPPLVRSLETPEWAERQAELSGLLADARRATGDRLGDAGGAASKEAKSLIGRFQTWRVAAADRGQRSAETTWQRVYDGAARRLDAAATTLEETKIGQTVVDLMQEGENDD
ncbi:MAG: hypothetical protein AAGM22_06135 [Acidobacteriota bacterium]